MPANDSRHRDYHTAVRLIRDALHPAARVEGIAAEKASDEAGTGETLIRISSTARPESAVLALSESPDAPKGADGVVLVLQKSSQTTLRALRADDEQFVDVRRGIVRLRLPWLHVDRAGLPIPVESLPPSRRAWLDPFGDRASLVARVLVERPERPWGAREIASEAGVSTMTASHVLRQLRELGIVDVRKRGRAFEARLTSVQQLVEHWTRVYDWRRSPSVAMEAPIGSPERFLSRLASALGDRRWALTMQAGASFVARHAAWDIIHVYVEDPQATVDDFARTTGWEPGPGQLVLMRPWYAHSAWKGARAFGNVNVVSDLQLVLDLWHYPVRGREQADVLLRGLEKRLRAAETTDA
jgi:hypothetical protein